MGRSGERPRQAGPANARRETHHGRNRHHRTAASHRQRRESQGPRHPRRHPHAASRSSASTARPPPTNGSILARFGGFGAVALSIFPDPVTGRYKDAGWQALGEELQIAAHARGIRLGQAHHLQRRSTPRPSSSRPCTRRSRRLGVPENATVLEPGCGTGNFLAHAAGGHALHRRRAGSASRAASPAPCIPAHDIRIENFRDTRLPEQLDAVIGNVPFADVQARLSRPEAALHDFFIAKSLDALKPGGVLALVTSHFTLDKQNAAVREYLAEQADFLGAIRLPSDAFKREGTAVVTDILFLRKRAPGAAGPPRRSRPGWKPGRWPSRASRCRSTAIS